MLTQVIKRTDMRVIWLINTLQPTGSRNNNLVLKLEEKSVEKKREEKKIIWKNVDEN